MLKSRKRLVIILSIIAAIFVLVVLTSALFSLKNVEVVYSSVASENSVVEGYKKDEIIKTGEFAYGKNILFLNYKNNIAKIEKAYPFAKVVKVERKFPNKAIIHIVERQPVFKVQVGSTYYCLDSDLKILSDNVNFSSNLINFPTLLNFTIPDGKRAGDQLSNAHITSVMADIFAGVMGKQSNISITSLKSINISNNEVTGEQEITIINNNDEVKIILEGSQNISAKIVCAYEVYNTKVQNSGLSEEDLKNTTITVSSGYNMGDSESDGTFKVTVNGIKK